MEVLAHNPSAEARLDKTVAVHQTAMILLFAVTLFVSAFLLFSVQPMVAKMLLPVLGGTPAVWNTCMVFFQAALLGGYAYALGVSRLRLRHQLFIQMLLLIGAGVSLPISLSAFWIQSVPATANPVWWVLACLTATVGLPFFITSSNGPLLQKWFATTGLKSADDPYFLYSASNAGSFVALLAYPVFLEPYFSLQSQSRVWLIGYVCLLFLVGLCAIALWRVKNNATPADESVRVANSSISVVNRLRWVVLAFIPSSLMLGVTNYLTTDVASVPLLWVIPLALYLLTLVLAFARRQLVSIHSLHVVLPGITLLFLFLYLSHISIEPSWMMALNLIYFFVASLTCHSQLAQERPGADRLPQFYLWLSVGGVLGGIFNVLIAPLLFTSIIEYPLMILAACLVLPNSSTEKNERRARKFDFVKPAIVLGLTLALAMIINRNALGTLTGLLIVFAIPMILTYPSRRRPLRFVLCSAAVLVGASALTVNHRTLHEVRNFFGVLRVTTDPEDRMHSLFHGSTIHGRQFTAPAERCEPLSYFHREGPLGVVFDAFRSSPAPKNVAIVGLGVGATMSHARQDEQWTFYEINPAVVDVARDARFFTYVGDCAQVEFNVVLGDARLKLQKAPDAGYGLIVLDAFSSDAIPVHLITQQALDLYLSKLAPHGLLVFHISNRNLDLKPVVADVAGSRNLTAIVLEDAAMNLSKGKDPSVWVVMVRDANDAKMIRDHPNAKSLDGDGRNLWTDDFSNILSVFRWQ